MTIVYMTLTLLLLMNSYQARMTFTEIYTCTFLCTSEVSCYGNDFIYPKCDTIFDQRKHVKMTIFVKNVEWFQTQSEIFITLPIKANKFTTDIVIATKFLKLSARPYFYELFFEQPVCAEQSTCRILESNIKFRLKKSTDSQWIRLGYAPKADENQGGCGFTNDTKKQILIEHENSIKDDLASKQKEKANLKRIEVDKEIERGNVIRSKIHETELALKEYHCQNVSLN